MLPQFNEHGLLPIGIYRATLAEFEERFVKSVWTAQRHRVFQQLRELVKEAAASGIVKRVLIGGSLVTTKPQPNDFDCLVVLDRSVTGRELRPFEYRLASRRAARRAFKGDAIPVIAASASYRSMVRYFQHTREGRRAGLVEIEL
jgi:hypothetical protein